MIPERIVKKSWASYLFLVNAHWDIDIIYNINEISSL